VNVKCQMPHSTFSPQSVPSRSTTQPLNQIDLAALTLDDSAQLVILTLLDHIGQAPLARLGTAAEGMLRQDQVALADAVIGEDLL
jgi:hypothetical protein